MSALAMVQKQGMVEKMVALIGVACGNLGESGERSVLCEV